MLDSKMQSDAFCFLSASTTSPHNTARRTPLLSVAARSLWLSSLHSSRGQGARSQSCLRWHPQKATDAAKAESLVDFGTDTSLQICHGGHAFKSERSMSGRVGLMMTPPTTPIPIPRPPAPQHLGGGAAHMGGRQYSPHHGCSPLGGGRAGT